MRKQRKKKIEENNNIIINAQGRPKPKSGRIREGTDEKKINH
jgi:hypothetical protein